MVLSTGVTAVKDSVLPTILPVLLAMHAANKVALRRVINALELRIVSTPVSSESHLKVRAASLAVAVRGVMDLEEDGKDRDGNFGADAVVRVLEHDRCGGSASSGSGACGRGACAVGRSAQCGATACL